jgi:hypothetical protein
METIHITKLKELRKNHPDEKQVKVDHGGFGFAILTFNCAKPGEENIPQWAKLGAYDGFGNFHFMDSEGTYHLCLKPKVSKSKIKTFYKTWFNL